MNIKRSISLSVLILSFFTIGIDAQWPDGQAAEVTSPSRSIQTLVF